MVSVHDNTLFFLVLLTQNRDRTSYPGFLKNTYEKNEKNSKNKACKSKENGRELKVISQFSLASLIAPDQSQPIPYTGFSAHPALVQHSWYCASNNPDKHDEPPAPLP